MSKSSSDWSEAFTIVGVAACIAFMVHSCTHVRASPAKEPGPRPNRPVPGYEVDRAFEMCDEQCRKLGKNASDAYVCSDGDCLGCKCGGRRIGSGDGGVVLWFNRGEAQ